MISLPFRVVCILIAGFLIVLAVTYIYKLNSRKVFWGVGLTTIIAILILLGLGVLRPSWGTETGTAVIVGISTAIGCAITLIYAAEDLHQKKRIKGKNIAAVGAESAQGMTDSERNKIKSPTWSAFQTALVLRSKVLAFLLYKDTSAAIKSAAPVLK